MGTKTYAVQATLTRQETEPTHTSQRSITEQGADPERVAAEAKKGIDAWLAEQK